jgi:hypothetical protein
MYSKEMKTGLIAEKPSVAREIAAIVGANNKEDGFLHGNNYIWNSFLHSITKMQEEKDCPKLQNQKQ